MNSLATGYSGKHPKRTCSSDIEFSVSTCPTEGPVADVGRTCDIYTAHQPQPLLTDTTMELA